MGPLSDASVVPLATLDPTAPLDDLAPLAGLIGAGVRVVAVGESTHGAREFYLLRHRLVRFLVERLGFTALAWESGFPEAFALDDYLQGRRDDRERVQVEGTTMHMGRCQEMGDLLDWLRGHNASGRERVRFYGLDLPGTAASLGPALEVVWPYVASVDPGFGPRLGRLRQLVAAFGAVPEPPTDKVTLAGSEALGRYLAIPAADRNELTALLADLGVRFDALRRTYVERSDVVRYEVVRQHLRVAARLDLQLRCVAAYMAGDQAACEANVRDATMADTVEWLLARERRVVVLAHNGHIQRTPIATPAGPIDTLGVHLAHRLGDGYLTLGTTCGGGDVIVTRTTQVEGAYETELVVRELPPAGADTLDGLLEVNLGGLTLLDLRTLGPRSAAALDATGRMRMLDQTLAIDVRRSFEMLLHVPRIGLWTSPLNALMPDLRGEAGGLRLQETPQ